MWKAMARLLMVFGLLLVALGEVRPQSPRLPEDELPPGALAQFGTFRLRHGEAVLSLVFAPDGKTLASAGESGRVRLWDVASGRQLREWPAGTGSWVCFSPDGKRLVCAGSENGICIRDAVSGKLIRRFPDRGGLGKSLPGQRGDHNGFVALAPDGKTVAEPAGTEVILWDTATGKERRRVKGHDWPVVSVAFSPDGKRLAAGDKVPGQQTTLLLWNVDSGEEVGYISGANETYSLAFAPEGKALASAGPNGTFVWELASRKRPRKLAAAYSVAFSPDGKQLAVAELSDSGSVHLFDTAKRRKVRTLSGQAGSVKAIAFAPEGDLLASADKAGVIRLWNTADGRETIRDRGHAIDIRAVAFAPDGKRVATASGADHTIRLWNSTGGAPLLTIDIPCAKQNWFCPHHHANLFAFAPDGKTILCDEKVFDPASGRQAADLPRTARAISADGKLLAGPHKGGRYSAARVTVWQRMTGRELANFEPFADRDRSGFLTSVAFSLDGRLLAVGAEYDRPTGSYVVKETVFLYDLSAGKLIRKFRSSWKGPSFLAFSPDSSWLMTSSPFREPIQLWRTADGREERKFAPDEVLHQPMTDRRPVALSPDGKLVASDGKNNSVVLWETLTGQEVHRLSGHRAAVHSLAFAPDGRTLLSASADTTALLWSLAPPLPKQKLTVEKALRLWRELANENAASAYRAAWQLARQPKQALPLLEERLHPLRGPEPGKISKLIADLDDKEFTIREAAIVELKELRSAAEPALRKALANKPTLEARKRIEELLDHLQRQPIPVEELRQLRAVQVLEWIQTPAAVVLIERLAGGDPLLRTTRDAKAALVRHNGKH